jgi:hypothetical protein
MTSKTTAKALLVIYIDVGNLPSVKAEALMERLQDKWKVSAWDLPKTVVPVWVPTRIGGTRIELIKF